MNIDDKLRDSLYDSVHEEFVGPVDPSSREELGEWDRPNKLYSAGILYPIGSEYEEFEEDLSQGNDGGTTSEVISEESRPTAKVGKRRSSDVVSDEDEPISLSNSDHQSAISLTFAVKPSSGLKIVVSAASYVKKEVEGRSVYKRVPIEDKISIDGLLAGPPKRTFPIGETKLEAMLVFRRQLNGVAVFTAALRNAGHSRDPKRADYRACYYQVGFKLESDEGFCPIPSNQEEDTALSEEDRSKELIYRNINNYAIGHGCAADWQDAACPKWVKTEIIPMAETAPIKTTIDGLPSDYFDMYRYSKPENWPKAKEELLELCELYENWISGIERDSLDLPSRYHRAANENISKCKSCLARIRRGIQVLENDEIARESFVLANKAMLDQYLHYSVVSNESDTIREPSEGLRFWRPFQIAFLVMNIESVIDPRSDDRKLLDLIWFPTGGGKTEAYLGLTAFTLIFERLNGDDVSSTSVIMRYTLRLLSAQQFDRAASLICALEVMHRSDPDKYGQKPFSIGLWAGQAASPNTWKEAIKIKDDLRSHRSSDKSIPVTCCPWCGEEMGGDGAQGYKEARQDKTKVLKFVCPNSDCAFGNKKTALPLKVVDEDIYADPPSLLLGTVDKFAMIPYRPDSYRIFGIKEDGTHVSAPKLIIQDELHLISGPLGSMVAHYETLISHLCSYINNGCRISPKVIASTATVSRAKEQCRELFACDESDVVQFPPSGIDHDDSFFSKHDYDKPGRRYVGLYVPNLSYATVSIRLYSRLLWTPATWEVDDKYRDPYWTVVGYYGTTRELGQAATWADSDIQERLFEKRRSCNDKTVRYLNKFIELTGRIDAPEVRKGLDELKIPKTEKGCIDLCLATNMISVGVDVSRLGLMVVAGQPKETSEYIQASSRVGRGDAKGVVFVMYGTQRPRDRSHYENFKNYHESFYKFVEPSSITAFCPQVRDRAMAGTVIGMYRSSHRADEDRNNPDSGDMGRIKGEILQRIEFVDRDEAEEARKQIDDIEEHWNGSHYERWQELNSSRERLGEKVPLMYPRGIEPLGDWGNSGFALPTSMRSVDQECEVEVVGRYDEVEGDE